VAIAKKERDIDNATGNRVIVWTSLGIVFAVIGCFALRFAVERLLVPAFFHCPYNVAPLNSLSISGRRTLT